MPEIDAAMARLSHKIMSSFADGDALQVATPSRIAELERMVGRLLPPELAYFLQNYQGAYIQNAVFEPAIEREMFEGAGGIETIYCYGFYSHYDQRKSSSSDVRQAWEGHKQDHPAWLVPFAELTQGAYKFSVSASPESYGQVFLSTRLDFDPEEPDFQDDDPADYVARQAASLADFLQSLRTVSDEQADQWYREFDDTGVKLPYPPSTPHDE